MNTDLSLQRNVYQQLEKEASLKTCLPTITIQVKDGVAILSGWVDNLAQKLGVQKAASSVTGIKSVFEELEIRPPFHRLDVNLNWKTGEINVENSYRLSA